MAGPKMLNPVACYKGFIEPGEPIYLCLVQTVEMLTWALAGKFPLLNLSELSLCLNARNAKPHS